MRPPDYLIKRGITVLPCIGDGRQSGTSGSPSILNASPEAAVGGGLAVLKTGDRIRIDMRRGTANVLLSDAALAERRRALEARAVTAIRHRKHRGRKFSAAWSTSWATAWCSNPR